jgi:hypothetical protein
MNGRDSSSMCVQGVRRSFVCGREEGQLVGIKSVSWYCIARKKALLSSRIAITRTVIIERERSC